MASLGFSRNAWICRAVAADLDDAELVGLRQRLADAGDRDPGPGGDVLGDHLLGVHPVDVVGAEHDDVVGVLVADEVEALVDGVGRAGEPVAGRAAAGPAPG